MTSSHTEYNIAKHQCR